MCSSKMAVFYFKGLNFGFAASVFGISLTAFFFSIVSNCQAY